MHNNEYFAAYDTIADRYIPSSMHKHKQDTQDYIDSQSSAIAARLVVRKVKITE